MKCFGLIPPPEFVGQEVYDRYVEATIRRLEILKPEYVLVYDIQDEKGRNGESRPFPFRRTKNPIYFGSEIQSQTGIPVILFQTLTVDKPLHDLAGYLDRLAEVEIRHLVWVGGGSDLPVQVPEALSISSELHPEINLGSITIAERHRDGREEVDRIMSKVGNGTSFFVTQIVYNADAVIALIEDYCKECRDREIEPKEIVLCFAPFGKRDTLRFLEWLGVEVPKGTAFRILRLENLTDRVMESIKVCETVYEIVTEAVAHLPIKIGFTVESVSKDSVESDGADLLFKRLTRLG